jgi:hypothetical protein
MARVLKELQATGLVIGGLTFDFCKRVSDPAQDVNTSGATLTELGNGCYLLDVTVTEDTAFRVHVTADPADYAVGILSNADGDLALQSSVELLEDEAFMGKWVLDPGAHTLTLYRRDGATVLKVFDLTLALASVPGYTGRTPR